MGNAAAPPVSLRFEGSSRQLLLLWGAFSVLTLAIYSPSLRGEFLSDDFGYIVSNPYIHTLSLENARELLDPFGAAAAYTANYAPVHLLLHAVEWRLFGPDTLGWRVVNVILHAGVSVLLVPVLARAGLSHAAAGLGALFFLLHPANVEVVAWIFQLKTILCLGFGILAVLAHPRYPAMGLVAFTLGILSKTTAIFALPVAVFLAWRRSRTSGELPPRFAWLAVWAAAFALYALPQFLAFQRLGEASSVALPDVAVQVRTMVAIAGRYLVMAATGFGTAAFQHPSPAASWFDPWWLVSLAVGGVLALRAAASLVRVHFEGAFWLWAAAAYLPVSQVFPFLHPMADRYLYVVLPGLIGVAWLASAPLLGSTGAWNRVAGSTRMRVVTALMGLLLVGFAVRSFERAHVFRSNAGLMLDSARNYPDGLSGSLLQARRLAQAEDAAGAVASLERARSLGFDAFQQLDEDPGLAPVRADPRFRAFVASVAGDWIRHARDRGYGTQLELRALAKAHVVRLEWREAIAVLEQAVAQGGPADAAVKAELGAARRQLARERPVDDGPPSH